MYYKTFTSPRSVSLLARLAFVFGASFGALSLPGSAEAAITYVNDHTVAATTTTQSSVTGTLTGVTAGDFLVAIVTTDQTATITKPSGWTDAGIRADSGASASVAMYTYASYPSSGTVNATFSFSAADGAGIVQIIELAGVAATSPVDVTATAFGHSNSASITASSATTAAGDVALIGWANDTTNRTFGNPTSPWVLINADVPSRSTDEQGTYETDVANGTTLTQTLSISRTSYWALAMITLKAAPLYWRGGLTSCATGSAFTSTSCWSTTSGGSSSGSAPSASDLVVFDGNGTGNCALSSSAATQAYSITTTSLYTGTITMGAQNVSLKGDLTINGGTFTGASGRTIATNQSGSYLGGLLVVGGTFNGNGAIVNVRSLTVSGGTYTQGGGTFTTNNSGTATFSGGTTTFSSGTSSFTTTLTTSGATTSLSFGTGAPTVTGTATFNAGTVAFGSGHLLLNGGLDVEGATVTLGSSASTTTVTGTVTVGSGILNLTNGSVTTDFSSTDVLTQSGGTINVNGAKVTIGTGVSGTTDAFVMTGGTFNNTTAGGSVTVGTTGGAGGDMNMSGTGAIHNGVSTASETFNGALTIAGTMSVGAVTMAGSTAARQLVSISSGATLTLSSAGFSFPSTNTMTIAGTLAAGTGTAVFSGPVSVTGTLSGASGTQQFADALTISGTVNTGAASMTGGTNGKKLVTISSGGIMSLSSSGFAFNSTSTMPIAGTLNTAGTVSFAGPVTLSGTFNGAGTASFADNVALSGTFNTNASTTTFVNTGTVTMSTGSVFNGDTGTTTFGAAPTLTAGTFSVADPGSAGSVVMTAGATFASGMTLAFPTSGGTLGTPGGQTLTMNGTVTSSAGGATTLPKIARSSGATGITIAFGATAVLNVDGLELDNSVSTGVTMANGATYTMLKRLKFLNNVANSTSTGATHLAITSSNTGGTKLITVPGCYFDATVQYNVTLSGVSGSTGVRAFFEYQSSTTNGPRAGESFDLDADTNDDNVADTTTANRYGSVVEWTYANPADTAGAALGPPVAAYDWNTFAFYGVYVSFKNIGGAGTSDRFWMRNTDGSGAYSYDVPNTSGDIVGPPRYDAINEVTANLDVNGDGDKLDTDVRVVYIGTSLGHIIKLIDTGSSFTPPASGAWTSDFTNAGVASITSALASDGTNLYFGGTNASAQTRIFGVQIAAGANEKTLQKTITPAGTGAITTAPAFGIYSGSTYLFIGSAAVASQAYIYRVQVSPGATIDASYTGATTNVNGLNLINNRLCAVTQGGKLYELDASNFNSGGFTTYTSFPYTGGAAISSAPYVDGRTSYAYFGDTAGKLYVVTSAGAALTGYPYTIAGTPQLTSTPYYKRLSGTIAVGGADGYAYFINRHDATNNPQIRKKYFVGTGSVTAISYDSATAQYMAASSDGHMTYINDADVGADADGVE